MSAAAQAAAPDNRPVPPLPGMEHEASDRSLRDDLRLLAGDARAFAEAEVAYQKVRAAFIGREAQRIAVLGIVALVLLWFVVLAVVVGAILALTPNFGALVATLIVGGVLAVLAIIAILLAAAGWKRLRHLASDGNAGDDNAGDAA